MSVTTSAVASLSKHRLPVRMAYVHLVATSSAGPLYAVVDSGRTTRKPYRVSTRPEHTHKPVSRAAKSLMPEGAKCAREGKRLHISFFAGRSIPYPDRTRATNGVTFLPCIGRAKPRQKKDDSLKKGKAG